MRYKIRNKLKLLANNYLHTIYHIYNFSPIHRLISKICITAFLLSMFALYSCKTCKCPAYSQIESQTNECSKYSIENHS